MAFNLSPSVDWAEQDYSLVATTQADTIGGYAGHFQWGAVDDPTLITGGEDDLVDRFYKPSNENYLDFCIIRDFLTYSKKAWLVRGVGAGARNATPSGVTPVLIKNDDEWDNDISGIHSQKAVGKYPGSLANGLALVALSADTFAASEYAPLFDFEPTGSEFNLVVTDTTGKHTGLGAKHQTERFAIKVGALVAATSDITISDGTRNATFSASQIHSKEDIADGLLAAFQTAFGGVSITATKVSLGDGEFAIQTARDAYEDHEPLTVVNADVDVVALTPSVVHAASLGSAVEIYSQVTAGASDKKPSGESAHFATTVNGQSDWVRIGPDSTLESGYTILSGGVDEAPTSLYTQYKLLEDSDQYDVNFIISGAHDVGLQQTASDVCATRRDCLGFFSPPMSAVVNNVGNELEDILAWRKKDWNKASSYDIIDGNWGQVYDQYNEVYRWIPCCGGTAGLVARTWYTDAPWVSPAFHQRGRYKNYRRLAWSPNKGTRDELYKAQVNPIINLTGEGRLLYGDKTGTPKDSAFNRINVRGMFIVVEKTIANLAKYYLGEVNDEFTRTQFLNVLTPYLRSVKQRRGMEDFRVVCDERNNDGQVRASNELRADIWIKPLYSINFVKLNFAAVRPDISFDELEGQLFG